MPEPRDELVDPPPTSGMFPGKPMARCSECDWWSYLAAYDGRCLSCVMSAAHQEDQP